jgi:hypothetical protein
VLSIIDVTIEEVRRRQWRRVGVVGLGDPVVYTRPLAGGRGREVRAGLDGRYRDLDRLTPVFCPRKRRKR